MSLMSDEEQIKRYQVTDFWREQFENVFFEGAILKESKEEYFFL